MGWLAKHWRAIGAILFSILVLGSFILYSSSRAPTTPRPASTTPIDHVVVIMKENHAFDNYFGTFPHADGIPPGVALPDGNGGLVAPHWLNATWTWSPPNSREAMLTAYDGGKNDGFATAAESSFPGLGAVAMGYYDRREVSVYWSLAENYTLADRYFQSIFGPTIPNRLYSFAGQSGNLTTNLIDQSGLDVPTIFDQLEAVLRLEGIWLPSAPGGIPSHSGELPDGFENCPSRQPLLRCCARKSSPSRLRRPRSGFSDQRAPSRRRCRRGRLDDPDDPRDSGKPRMALDRYPPYLG